MDEWADSLPRQELAYEGAERLYGRSAELAAVAEAVDRARAGRSGLVLVSAGGGGGKTAVLNAAARLARGQGLRVLRARASWFERGFDWGVAGQLLGARPDAGRGPDRGLPSYAQLDAMLGEVAALAADRPLAVVVDDLPLADAPSLRFLAFLARRLPSVPVLLLLSAGPADPAVEPEMLAELLDHPDLRVLYLRPLTGPEVAALIEDRVGRSEPELAAAVTGATGGVPALVRDVLDLLARDDGGGAPAHDRVAGLAPPAVARRVLSRVTQQSTTAADVAVAVAVLGEGTLAHAAALAGRSTPETLEAAELLARSGLLEDGPPLRFAQPVVRSAVYASTPARDRRRLHGRAAQLLHEMHAPVDEIADHLLRAGPGDADWAADLLRSAARAAAARGELRRAERCAARAVDLCSAAHRAPALRELGVLLSRLDPVRAVAPLAESRAVDEDPVRRAGTSVRLVECLGLAGRADDARAVVRGLLGDLYLDLDPEQAPEPAHLGPVLGLAVLHDLTRPDGAEDGAAVVRRLRRGTAQVPSDPTLHAAVAVWRGRAGTTAAVLAAARQGLRRPAAGDPGLTPVQGVLPVLWADDVDLAQLQLDRWRELSGAGPSPLAAAVGGAVARRRGALPEAVALARRGFADGAGADWLLVTPGSWLVETLVDAGRPAEAGDVLARLPRPEPGWSRCAHLLARGRLLLARGRPGAALLDLEECGRLLGSWGVRGPALAWRPEAALAHLAAGDRDAAAEHARAAVADAARWGTRAALGTAHRVHGLVAGGRDGTAELEQAVRLLDGAGHPLELARALLDLGGLLRRGNLRKDARQHLQRTVQLAQRCGAQATADAAHDELLAAGARPRRQVRIGVEALTASELRVAAKAAEGRTNREIAEVLYVSQRTVELHLTSTYRKLDIAGRSQLARLLVGRAGTPV